MVNGQWPLNACHFQFTSPPSHFLQQDYYNAFLAALIELIGQFIFINCELSIAGCCTLKSTTTLQKVDVMTLQFTIHH